MKNIEYDKKVNPIIKPLYFLGICIVIGGCMAGEKTTGNSNEQRIIVENDDSGFVQSTYGPLLNEEEVIEYLGIDGPTLYTLTSNDGSDYKGLPYLQVDEIKYYPKERLDKWLKDLGFLTIIGN
ncbi:helix-turn-helix domain-containing protein [Viridibacillus sp. FSL H8-0123]|uniref:helix-turn-helix domain-containing protein n=1 Tax=Viridibacillus sp. FSL H8-0123 TaxID=1928922 RepID=UPI00096E4754|nr:helix-turn-helix domain-containing protein [Viridibacillus sp. FSL H8-0123]OMC84577.1 hypothetical protein BK130_02840 [Viridibacillus sp. FSL H8-0123]